MGTEKRDPVTGRLTTGHEWNGIEELDTPIPRVVLFFLGIGIFFSIIYWIFMPAWPSVSSYTKGLLGFDQREVVTRQVQEAAAARASWTDKIANTGFAEIAADEALMRHVRETGPTLFADNCAVCHGVKGTGGPGFPNLTTGAWLWGGDPDTIAQTIRVGINSTDDGTRVSQMLAFGRDGILTPAQVSSVAAYVRSLSGQTLTASEQARLPAGRDVFKANCVSCHGESGKGIRDVGAPDLTDHQWIYGGDAQSVYTSIYGGRQGHMPYWRDRLSPSDIKLLTLYVGTLGKDATLGKDKP
ncbi:MULTISPECIES: cytochrome-c oxidase, cbb3-type subunit III [unclassified Chelatococcus]|uniref:cytochrome-c oxidase, cbb3-type subunit III n=1 Tax=unclassified Chelatococcus TaxID=2638111 RepID=UPI001BCDB75F|nr:MULTISPECIES: cytochrome-c oxidase, cbb3-type subunit III [unclassified Chelatococcus]CAH1651649.1 Cbb3-type cytochrome c oxidase subunit FixP [Hyphomicrobiales bacterium]MBS7743140.1 cytochrome-c oxidase, cbb3-type subunit III [Chelatococcus sp. HY11]MBX3541742.1 cytochrome-c oxidase, cbb3-type subunit III [Chelatococcus sp.]MCO5074366.1 cytochrome-c oxidase, cbb3-type subunit III [Chelatococcus sp.]CAH1693395.1 Cbb3-type cytochrome c oxidase subunit FixP [Hyphomicrobiales bacterium]